MSSKSAPIPPRTIGSITGVLLASGFILLFWGRADGPDWAQWLGTTFLACVLLIPGIVFFIDPQLSLSWFRALTPRRRDGYVTEPLIWQRLQTGERILAAAGIFAVSAVGVLILYNTLPPLLRIWGLL